MRETKMKSSLLGVPIDQNALQVLLSDLDSSVSKKGQISMYISKSQVFTRAVNMVILIFNYAFGLLRVAFKPYFKEVYFIPNHPSLRKAKQIIDAQQTPITTLKQFKAELHASVKSIATENEEVLGWARFLVHFFLFFL